MSPDDLGLLIPDYELGDAHDEIRDLAVAVPDDGEPHRLTLNDGRAILITRRGETVEVALAK